MKKICAMLLVLSLAIVSLTACSNEPAKDAATAAPTEAATEAPVEAATDAPAAE